jgi:hypothetical protein
MKNWGVNIEDAIGQIAHSHSVAGLHWDPSRCAMAETASAPRLSQVCVADLLVEREEFVAASFEDMLANSQPSPNGRNTIKGRVHSVMAYSDNSSRGLILSSF